MKLVLNLFSEYDGGLLSDEGGNLLGWTQKLHLSQSCIATLNFLLRFEQISKMEYEQT